MLNKIITLIVVFALVMAGLTFGETAWPVFLAWLSNVVGTSIQSVSDLYDFISNYLIQNQIKVSIGVVLTIVISGWLFFNDESPSNETNKKKQVAATLAILVGLFGIHKFYLGQKGQGFVYLLFSVTAIPFFFALADAFRYLRMTSDEFSQKYLEQSHFEVVNG